MQHVAYTKLSDPELGLPVQRVGWHGYAAITEVAERCFNRGSAGDGHAVRAVASYVAAAMGNFAFRDMCTWIDLARTDVALVRHSFVGFCMGFMAR